MKRGSKAIKVLGSSMLLAIVGIAGALYVTRPVIAVGDEGNPGYSTGSSKCGNQHTVCTTDGSYWQYYKIDKSNNTVYPSNPDTTVRADGSINVRKSRVYGKVTFYGGDITNTCYEIGGYFRRSVVDHGYLPKGHGIYKGDGHRYVQVGLTTTYTPHGVLGDGGEIIAYSSNDYEWMGMDITIDGVLTNMNAIYQGWRDYAFEHYHRVVKGLANISWFCWDKEMNNPGFSSKTNAYSPGYTTVTSGWNDDHTDPNWTENPPSKPLVITAEAGESVTVNLNSYLKSSSSEKKKTKFQVRHTYSASGATGAVTINGASAASFSGVVRQGEFETDNVNAVDSSIEHSVMNPANPQNAGSPGMAYTVTFPEDAKDGASITLCEYIDYYKNEESTGFDGGTHACVVVKVSKPVVTYNCTNATSTTSLYYGDTQGQSKVKNYSSRSYNTWGDEAIAKPGDTIQFCHSLSFGNRKVGDGLVGAGSPPSQKFEIKGYRDSSLNSKYTFASATSDAAKTATGNSFIKNTISGRSSTPLGNSTLNTDDKFYSKRNGVQTGEYYFTVYSPFDNTNYRCNKSVFNTNNYTYNGFQVPGFITGGGSCSAASQTGNTVDVGISIAQELNYDKLYGWVNTSHEDNYGTCACATANRIITNYSLGTYEEAVANSRTWGRKSPDGNICQTNSKCCTQDTGPPYYICTHYEPTYTTPSTSVSYPTTWENRGNGKDIATVYIPYNYNTSVSASISNSDVHFLGGRVDVKVGYEILPRYNDIASPNRPSYATITPTSTFAAYELLIPSNLNPSGDQLTGDVNSSRDLCAYYRNKIGGSIECSSFDSTTEQFNKEGSYAGSDNTDDGVRGSYARTIPDITKYVGWKYCIGSSITSSSSHDSENNTVGNNKSGSAFGSGNGKTNVSSLSCVTIAKKPNFQVWGGGTFTQANITTSVSRKMVGYGLGDYDDYKTDYFGSWDEYGIIAASSVQGMASGAGLGYDSGYTFNRKKDYTYKRTLSDVSPETIANTPSIGESGVTSWNSTSLPRLKSRYRDAASANDASDNRITQTITGAQYFYYNGDASISDISSTITNKGSYANTTNSGSYSTLRKAALAHGSDADNTLVIYVNGTLTIDRNICYAASSSDCANKPATTLSSYNLSTDAISALPQILIFADDIEITSNVTRIEAWLIADEGYVSTCEEEQPDANQCNKTLVVSGPIFTRSLLLKRTAGALGGASVQNGSTVLSQDLSDDGSITPAEIFILRSDAYYWSYNQAQRLSQAVTTYVRELAPRY